MSLNESRRNLRDRWPLEFELTGVTRDNAERERLLQQKLLLEEVERTDRMNKITPVKNQFAVDYQQGQTIDLSQPPKFPYNPRDPQNEFPKILYHHDSGHVLKVDDAKQEKASLKRGYQHQPAPGRDYSRATVGTVAPAKAAATSEPRLSAEELVELDEVDNRKED